MTLILKKSHGSKCTYQSVRLKLNRSAFPIACLHSQSYHLSKNLDEKIPAILLMLAGIRSAGNYYQEDEI